MAFVKCVGVLGSLPNLCISKTPAAMSTCAPVFDGGIEVSFALSPLEMVLPR